MIRKGNSVRGEGATCWGIATRIDTRRRRRVDGSVYAAAVLFPPYRENVTIVFHGPGSNPGVPALLTARDRDIEIARDKPDSNLAISFGKTRPIVAFRKRNRLLAPPRINPRKDANSTWCGLGLRRIFRGSEKRCYSAKVYFAPIFTIKFERDGDLDFRSAQNLIRGDSSLR